jgi:hypothetical protein
MPTEIQIEPIQRTCTVPRPIISGGTTETLPKGNAKTQSTTTESFSISDISVAPVLAQPLVSEEFDVDKKALARLIVNVTRNFAGNIDEWQFSVSDSLDDLILRCTSGH